MHKRNDLLALVDTQRHQIETAETEERNGIAYCSHCDWHFHYEVGSESQTEAATTLAEHASACEANPNVKRWQAAEALLETRTQERDDAIADKVNTRRWSEQREHDYNAAVGQLVFERNRADDAGRQREAAESSLARLVQQGAQIRDEMQSVCRKSLTALQESDSRALAWLAADHANVRAEVSVAQVSKWVDAVSALLVDPLRSQP